MCYSRHTAGIVGESTLAACDIVRQFVMGL